MFIVSAISVDTQVLLKPQDDDRAHLDRQFSKFPLQLVGQDRIPFDWIDGAFRDGIQIHVRLMLLAAGIVDAFPRDRPGAAN